MVHPDDIVRGRPSKAFFIDMITRDLSITDCILDLIDNAVDKAVETRRADVMKTLMEDGPASSLADASVELNISPTRFVIEDTCGGISVDEARSTVFLFGNPEERGAVTGLSVYGIGMKRAFFKLGRRIVIDSTTSTDWFQIDINVEEWQARGDENWDFEFTAKGPPNGGPNRAPGTRIEIRHLHPEVAERFRQVSFVRQLEEKLSMAYSLFAKAGLRVSVNGRAIEVMLPLIGTNKKVTPARKLFTHDGVDILIVAGVTPKDDRTPRGWYIFCNGRMVLEADRSAVTGWGSGLPKWHTKYGHFVGYVYFRSNDVRKLPWTTTKQNIMVESPVYQAALAEMQIQSRPVLNYLNDLYPGEVEPEGVAERELLEGVKKVEIDQVPRSDAVFRVDLGRDRDAEQDAEVSIQYRKKQSEVDLIRKCCAKLRQASARKIGEYTFDYFVNQECK